MTAREKWSNDYLELYERHKKELENTRWWEFLERKRIKTLMRQTKHLHNRYKKK